MYIHILLLLFLICLFVLSLEQAQTDFQHHVNTNFTNHEIHPGETKSIHTETDQGTRIVNLEQNLFEPNSRNRDQRFVFVLENNESIPSCSFTKAFDEIIHSNNGEITDGSNFLFNESQNSTIQTQDKEKLKLVPVCADILKLRELVNKSYENYDAVNVYDKNSDTTANRYSPVTNDTNLNSYNDEFVLNEKLLVFTNYTNNKGGSNNDTFTADVGNRTLNDDDIKFDRPLTSNQSNKITDSQESVLNDARSGCDSLTLDTKDVRKTQRVRPAYYISENERNVCKTHSPYDVNKSKYKKINYQLLMMPMLLSEKMLRNMMLFTNLDLINTTEQFDFQNDGTTEANDGIEPISLVNEYPKPLSTINLDGYTSKQPSMIENTRKSSTDYFKTLTSVVHKPTKKTVLKNGTAKSAIELSTGVNHDVADKNVSPIKSLQDTSVSPTIDLINNELTEQILKKVLQNFLGLLDTSNDSSFTRKGGEPNKKSTHFTPGPGGGIL